MGFLSQAHTSLKSATSGLGFLLVAACAALALVYLVAFWRSILGGAIRDALGLLDDVAIPSADGSCEGTGTNLDIPGALVVAVPVVAVPTGHVQNPLAASEPDSWRAAC